MPTYHSQINLKTPRGFTDLSKRYALDMAKKLSLSDFRALRTVLEAEDFAYAPGPRERPVRDLIEKSAWDHIQTLPETVSIFTSNDHGKELRLMSDLWGSWVEVVPIEKGGVVKHACLIATDEFQASTFNALHGYYRVAADCLRSVIEQMTIAVEYQLRHSDKQAVELLSGEELPRFGAACDSLQSRFSKTRLRNIFQQDDGKRAPGWIRGLHDALSNYTHSRQGFDAMGLWQGSNGPIYVKSAFKWVVKMWLFTYASCVILLRITDPSTPQVGDIFSNEVLREITVVGKAAEFLWREAGTLISDPT